MGLIEALEAESFVPKEKTRISKHWESLSLTKESLKWFYSLKSDSATFHEQVLLTKVPENATGHEGIAHGGFIAALLDEALCYGAFPILPHKIGVTASLSVNYLAPTPAGAHVLIRSKAQCKEGSRRADVTAHVYSIDIEDTQLPWDAGKGATAEATEVVVEPKWYEKLTYR